jgi:hypothetical protein
MTDRISEPDKIKLMGGNVARVYGWSPQVAAAS